MFPRHPISRFSSPPISNGAARGQGHGLTINNNAASSTTMIFTTPGSYKVSIQHQVVAATTPHPPPPRETRMRSTPGAAMYFRKDMESESDSPWSTPRTPSPRYSPLAYGNLARDGRVAPQSSTSPSSSSQRSLVLKERSQEAEMADGNGAISTPANSQTSSDFGSQSSPSIIPATPPQTPYYADHY